MSPVVEIRFFEIPKEVHDILPKKDRARLFRSGFGILTDLRNGGTTEIVTVSDEVRDECRRSVYKYLYEIKPASTPETQRRKNEDFYGE